MKKSQLYQKLQIHCRINLTTRLTTQKPKQDKYMCTEIVVNMYVNMFKHERKGLHYVKQLTGTNKLKKEKEKDPVGGLYSCFAT